MVEMGDGSPWIRRNMGVARVALGEGEDPSFGANVVGNVISGAVECCLVRGFDGGESIFILN